MSDRQDGSEYGEYKKRLSGPSSISVVEGVAFVLKNGSTPEKMIDPQPVSGLSMCFLVIKEHVAAMVMVMVSLICILGSVTLRLHNSARRVVCVGAAEMSMLGAFELTLTNGGIEPCSDRKPWLLAIKHQGGRY